MDDLVHCLVRGCDFTVEHEDGWREVMEQHVRWLQVAPRDFGEFPIPALLTLMMNGVIRQDECMKLTQEIFDRDAAEMAPVVPPFELRPFATAGVAAILFGITLNAILAVRDVGWLTLSSDGAGILRTLVSVAFFTAAVTFFRSIRRIANALVAIRAVRFGSYPDTTNDVDDSGGDDEQREPDRPPDP